MKRKMNKNFKMFSSKMIGMRRKVFNPPKLDAQNDFSVLNNLI